MKKVVSFLFLLVFNAHFAFMQIQVEEVLPCHGSQTESPLEKENSKMTCCDEGIIKSIINPLELEKLLAESFILPREENAPSEAKVPSYALTKRSSRIYLIHESLII